MRIIIIVLLMFIFVALQISLSPMISIKDVAPNFILLFVFYIAFSFGAVYGLWFGFFSGFLCDLFNAQQFGLNMGFFLIIGFVIGLMRSKFYRDNLVVEIIIFSVVLLFYELFYSLVLWQFTAGIYFLNIIRYTIPRVLYTTLIGFFVFSLFRRIHILKPGH